jgi:hypothetical protein
MAQDRGGSAAGATSLRAASRVNHRLSLGNAAITVTPAEATRVLPKNQTSRPSLFAQQPHFFGKAPSDLGISISE